ncbi:hypothetical protein Tsp_06447 [Trichinella spiralis]|uniref:hypothetical protein n=1 Tax=Trichinella spiralis TaxID=6334 RepID=UPI0001EFC6C3|nr:hypothetical protein Tsp_06447 [Trichinella spiralis]
MFPSDLHLSVEHPAFCKCCSWPPFSRNTSSSTLSSALSAIAHKFSTSACDLSGELKSAASEFKFGSYFSADEGGNFEASRGGGARAVLGLLIRALLEGLSTCSEFCISSSAVAKLTISSDFPLIISPLKHDLPAASAKACKSSLVRSDSSPATILFGFAWIFLPRLFSTAEMSPAFSNSSSVNKSLMKPVDRTTAVVIQRK